MESSIFCAFCCLLLILKISWLVFISNYLILISFSIADFKYKKTNFTEEEKKCLFINIGNGCQWTIVKLYTLAWFSRPLGCQARPRVLPCVTHKCSKYWYKIRRKAGWPGLKGQASLLTGYRIKGIWRIPIGLRDRGSWRKAKRDKHSR